MESAADEVPLAGRTDTEKLELIVEASSRLLGSLDVKDVLSSILDLASRTIPVDAYCIWRRVEGSELWRAVIWKGLSEDYVHQAIPSTEEQIPDRPMIFDELQGDSILAPRIESYQAEGIRSVVAMPLTIRGEVAGTLAFYSRRPHVFEEADLKLATALANIAGAALTSAELYEEQSQLLREKEVSQQKAAFLAEASQILASSLDYETTLGAIARLAIGQIADWCLIDIVEEHGEAPRRLAMAHADPSKIRWAHEIRRRYPPHSGESSARVIRTGEPILLPEVDEEQLVRAARDEEHLRILRALTPASFLCVPMSARGKTLGALSFLTTESKRRYSEADLAFAQDLANRCALAIDNARLYTSAMANAARERESRTEVETLNRVGQLLSAELNLQKLTQAVTDAATEISGAQFGSFFYNVLSENGDYYMLYTLSGVPREKFASFPMPRATAMFGPTFRGEGIVRIADVSKDPRYGKTPPHHGMPPGHLPVASYLAVPVTGRSGQVIGGLFFGHEKPGMFTERHERAVAALAAQTAIAMENAMLLDSVEKARREVSDAHEQLSNVLESTRDAFVAVDDAWRITHCNAGAAAMAGLSRGELIGKDVRELLAGTGSQNALSELRRAAETRTPVQFEECFGSSSRWLEISIYPTRFGLAVFGRDVTEKKRFDEQLRQTAKLESLGVLAGGVAHDFNNILVGILGNATLALESIPPEDPVRETLQDVVSATERASNLTHQLLAYAGKGRFVVKALDLSDLLREMSPLLQTSIPRSVRLKMHLAQRLPSVEADATQMQQLFMNLIINGAEAIEENTTGTVSVTTGVQFLDEDYIRHILEPFDVQPGKYVVVEVSDNGSGMQPETITRIFDPFFTTKFTGRGLGLAAALGIVRGHGGALKVYSTPGHGSTFKVLLPTSNSRAEKKPQDRQEIPSGTGLILIVDDEEFVRRVAQKTLERYGYQVITAEDGSEGVKLFESIANQVSLVILDLTMPVMGGEEALRQMKKIRPDIRVVLSSGFSEAEAVQRFSGQGLTGFLQKPYSAPALAKGVAAALE